MNTGCCCPAKRAGQRDSVAQMRGRYKEKNRGNNKDSTAISKITSMKLRSTSAFLSSSESFLADSLLIFDISSSEQP
jgi:hypothetical protein